ncbi:YIP1 family protein [Alteribacter aurantiacus]|uniref:YIP1 family protein n=1 Tax=Alteribacter aurantiacus TaxID=254410 RepID=UPI000403C541|nr:YIP1 family protein [Alteribacter aurantiacus]
MSKVKISFVMVFLFLFFPVASFASVSVPYKTETLSAEGRMIETQTAYVPVGLFGSGTEMISPEDIFVNEENQVYLADSGTQLITVFNENGRAVEQIGEGVLVQPTGVYADEEGKIFVADYGAEKVFRFSADGNLEEEFGRPESPLFGSRSPYKPQKVAVDRRGNMYVVGEGSTNGIIQMNREGGFLGYFGVNRTDTGVLSSIQDLLTTERQRERMFLRVPPAPTNVALDDQGLVYSVTAGTDFEVIRKLNIAGANMLDSDISSVRQLTDIAVGPINNMVVVSSGGRIYEYDSFGNLLFRFGGRDDGSNRMGLFTSPSAVDVDNYGRIFVTDSERGTVQLFERSTFTEMLHSGIALFAEGYYVESEHYWNEVQRLNSSFGLAHTAMGEAYFKQQEYVDALEEYRQGHNKTGYSNAFWELRNEWMQSNLGLVFTLILGVFFLRSAVIYADRKKKILDPLREEKSAFKKRKLVSDLLFLFRFLRHPIDSFYYIRESERGTILSATILYGILFGLYLFMILGTGFLFTDIRTEPVNIFSEFLTLFIPLALFITANYLVSTINDGEGRLRDIYIGTVYSLGPIFVGMIPITLISNILTLNEAFIYTFSMQIIIGWSLFILITMIRTVHDYSFFETVRNIAVTLFMMVIMVLVFFIIYILMDQVVSFVYSIIQEVILRV